MDSPKTPFQRRLAEIGDRKAAEQLAVKERTVKAWRLGDRRPRMQSAREITARWPVTLEDIYTATEVDPPEYGGPERRAAA